MILSYFQEMRWILYFLVKLHNVLCNFVILFLGFYYKFDRVFSDIYFNFMTTPDKREYRKLIFASHLNCLQGCHIIAFAFKLSINCNCNVYSLQISETNTNKLISMMRGKSPPSEHISRKHEVEQPFGFYTGFRKGVNVFVCFFYLFVCFVCLFVCFCCFCFCLFCFVQTICFTILVSLACNPL